MKANKLKLWWWLLTGQKLKFDNWLNFQLGKREQEVREKLTKDFKLKLKMIESEPRVAMNFGVDMNLLEFPIWDYEDRMVMLKPPTEAPEKSGRDFKSILFRSNEMGMSFANTRIPLSEIKREASYQLAQKLIELDTLETIVHDGRVFVRVKVFTKGG